MTLLLLIHQQTFHPTLAVLSCTSFGLPSGKKSKIKYFDFLDGWDCLLLAKSLRLEIEVYPTIFPVVTCDWRMELSSPPLWSKDALKNRLARNSNIKVYYTRKKGTKPQSIKCRPFFPFLWKNWKVSITFRMSRK